MLLVKEFTIENKLGLHARPSAQLVKSASKFTSQITVEKEGEVADGKSIIGIMMLAAGCGSQLKVSIDGDDAQGAMDAIEELIASKFGE